MLRLATCTLLLGAVSASALAQQPCAGAAVELARQSPRAILGELADSTGSSRASEGVACVTAASPLVGRSVPVAGRPLELGVLPPTARLDFIGGLPQDAASGSAWLGRGANLFLRPAVTARWGALQLVVAPEYWVAQNRPYDVFPSPDASRSTFASPWYWAAYSADLPSRPGVDRLTHLDPGQTALWASFSGVDLGVATSAQRWGPGRRGGLVLGPDAPGVPRVFARTATPVATPIGAVSGTSFIGTVTESRYFDRADSNDYRTLGGLTVSWRRAPRSPFLLGFAFAFMRAGSPFASGPRPHGKSENVRSLFAELGSREAGSRVYAEAARAGELLTLREMLTVPYRGIAYLVGFEHAIRRAEGTLLVAAETANLEQPTDVRGVATQDFYTSSVLPHGWTHRGQLLGYPTGPGSNSASLSLDWVAASWSAGLFGERTRWNDDALYRVYFPNAPRHDVSVRGGVRGGYLIGRHELTLELSTGKRLNYLFQNDKFSPAYRTVDVSLPQLRIGLTPRLEIP